MLHSRADVMELLQLERDVDLLIPRGGKEFVEPRFRGRAGFRCWDMAKEFAMSMCTRRRICTRRNALCWMRRWIIRRRAIRWRRCWWTRRWPREFLPRMVEQLRAAGVEVRGCEQTRALAKSARVKAASEARLGDGVRRPDPVGESGSRFG